MGQHSGANQRYSDPKTGDAKVVLRIAGPASYDTGGSILDVKGNTDPEVGYVDQMVVTQQNIAYSVAFVPTPYDAGPPVVEKYQADECKVVWIDRTTGAEPAPGTNLAAQVFEAEFRVYNNKDSDERPV